MLHKADLGLTNPFDTVYHVAPCMGVILFPFALYLEGSGLLHSPMLFEAPSIAVVLQTAAAIGFGGSLAFGLTMSEFFIVYFTSG